MSISVAEETEWTCQPSAHPQHMPDIAPQSGVKSPCEAQRAILRSGLVRAAVAARLWFEGRQTWTECRFPHWAASHAMAGQQHPMTTSCRSLRRGSEAGGCRKGACNSMETAATRLATPCWPPQA